MKEMVGISIPDQLIYYVLSNCDNMADVQTLLYLCIWMICVHILLILFLLWTALWRLWWMNRYGESVERMSVEELEQGKQWLNETFHLIRWDPGPLSLYLSLSVGIICFLTWGFKRRMVLLTWIFFIFWMKTVNKLKPNFTFLPS